MRIKKMVIALLAAAMITVLTGCSVIESIFIRNPSDIGNGDYSVITASSPSALEDGCFYVEKGEKEYHKTYIGKKNYSDYYLTESVDPNRVIWFGKDYDRIPTMQKGEKIVFRSSQEFRPYFIIERFEDFGFTVGVCGLKETDTGRYILSASNYNYISVNPDSSAKALLDLGELQNHVHGTVIAQSTAVDAEVVALGTAPALVGIIIVIAGTALVRAVHHVLCLILGDVVLRRQMTDLVRLITADENADHIRIIRKCVIRAAADDHAGFSLSQTLDGIKLG